MEALRARRTVVTLADGSLHGDAEAKALLTAEPLAPVPDLQVTSTGGLDDLGRVLGFVGLVGLVLFRRTARA